MRRPPLVFMLLAALLATVGTARMAMAFDLMLDTSGSMHGFQASGAFAPLWAELRDAAVARDGNTYWFAEGSGELKGQPQFDGSATRLQAAVKTWIDQKRTDRPLVIVTDNVADDRNTVEGRAQRDFYKSLESFRFVSMINARLPFHGTVYAPDYRAGRDGKADYKGLRALAFYILSLPPARSEGRRQEDYPVALEVHQTISKIVKRQASAMMEMHLLPFDYSNWQIQAGGSGARILRGPNRDEGPIVDVLPGKGLHVRDFRVGDDLSFSFQTEVHPGGSFSLNDATITADVKFSDESVLLAERLRLPTQLPVTPRVASLSPDPAKGTKVFTITVDIPEFGFMDLPFMDQVAMAMNDAILASGTISLRYRIESKANVEVFQDTLTDWNFEGAPSQLGRSPTSGPKPTDPRVHEKIYRLKDLVYEMLPATALQNRQEILQTIPVTIELRSSAVPLVSLMALVGAVGVGILYFGSRVLHGSTYLLEDDMGQEQATIPTGFASSSIFASADNQVSGRLLGFGPVFWVSSPDRLRSTRLMFGDGPISIQTRGSDEEPITYSFRLRRVTPSTDAIANDEWGENL